jgi:hypothetical protein
LLQFYTEGEGEGIKQGKILRRSFMPTGMWYLFKRMHVESSTIPFLRQVKSYELAAI